MENLMKLVPEDVKQRIGESTPDDLISTSTSLMDFFHTLPLYHQIIEDLTAEKVLCGKNMEAAMELKVKGNECSTKGNYKSAVRFYSQALRVAPANADDISQDPVALLYGNRAYAFYNMGLLMECLHDTTRALSIFPAYTKAWFRRGKAYASLGNYEDAIRSWNIASKVETSLIGKKQIEREIEMVINKPKGATVQLVQSNGRKTDDVDEPFQVELQSIVTRSKGRGMVSIACIPEASLIHKEDAYAAIILEQFRETHCHFCFSELPVDVVPCSWCSTSLYCSVQCQVQAGGQKLLDFPGNISVYENLPDDLAKYVSEFYSHSIPDSRKVFTEHGHECQGVRWPLALPAEIVLVGRVLAKHIKQRSSGSGFDFLGIWDLCHNYAVLPPETKLVYHIYAIALLHCLQSSFGSELPVNGKTVSEIIILMSQVRVNLMAIVCLKTSNLHSSESYWDIRANVEQGTVGQAVYSVGSFFNHSCLPNIHSYFISRTLYIRATEFVAAESHLELSYGPQVGQSDCNDRRKYLEGRYSFWCECRGCAQPSLSDLVLDAYRCVNPNCFGVVLNSDAVKYEKQKFQSFLGVPSESSSNIDSVMYCSSLKYSFPVNVIQTVSSSCFASCTQQLGELRTSEIGRIVRYDNLDQWEPGHCLNCQASHDVQASRARIEEETNTFSKRLQDAVDSDNIPGSTISETLLHLDLLRKILHPYNKTIAKVEDVLAQAFCLVGAYQAGLDHCQKSTQVRLKLYGPNHIAIGNDLVKAASVQISLRDHDAVADGFNRAALIFSRYYGAQANEIFPLLQALKNLASKHGF